MFVCLSLPLLADEVSCQIGTYKYEGVVHLSLSRTIKTIGFTSNGLGTQTKTSSATMILHYWPGFHELGIAEVERALDEYKCSLNSALIKCSLVKENENCKEVLKLTRVSDGQEIHTIPNLGKTSMEDALADFKAVGICH